MRLALPVAIVVVLTACGTVENDPVDAAAVVDSSPIDAEPGAPDASFPDAEPGAPDAVPAPDARACAGNTIEACGDRCEVCTVSSERQVPICDGTRCGFTCRDSAPVCSDGSCSRLSWNFEDNNLGGVFNREPSSVRAAVRNLNGANAVAVDTSLGEIAIQVPVCVTGVLDTRARTLTFDVFLQDGSTGSGGYYVQAEIPNHQNGAYLRQIEVGSGRWTTYSAPMNLSQFANTTSFLSILVGSLGGAFTGTVWVDNVRIQ